MGEKVEIHNKISPVFQQVSVDGAYGGVTPQGKININFYAERLPIPKSSTFEIIDNKIAKKISDSEDSKKGIIRDFSFGIYMNLKTAKSLAAWLQDQINRLESLNQDGNNVSDPCTK